VIAENLPYPTFKGGDLRNWQNVNALMKIGEVGVFGLCSNDTRRAVPQPELALWRSSADPDLAFPPQENRKLAARGWLVSESGHPADLYYSERAAAEIEDLVSEFDPHLIVLERLWLHRYINHVNGPNRRIVLDNHNVEAALYRQIAASMDGDDLRGRLMRSALPARTEMIERQAVQAVDQVWVCSNEDERLLGALYGATAPIRVVPNGLDIDGYNAVHNGVCARPKTVLVNDKAVIFPAMFAYSPNARSADFLIEQVFPRLLATAPNCQLLLIGGMPTPQMIEAAIKESRIVVTGAVPDVRPYLAAASLMIVPLFEGSGTRYKILEAFAAKVPVISTAQGAQGLEVEDGKYLLIAESAGEFADAAKRLWADKRLAHELTESALALVKERYSWQAVSRSIEKAVNELTTTSS
jgi:glycosyltransferase involved in cell wall biosynthesis